MPAVLGLDLGTSQVKALLCDTDGTVLGQGTAGYPVSVPQPGWAEADPGQWWQAACAAVQAAAGAAGDQVTAVAVAGQMHGVVLSAERNVVLRPAITWLDRRAEDESADYQRLPADLRASLGNAPSPGMAGPVLLWLSRHEPGRYQQARWALQPKDWLRQQLTGALEAVTDPTDASGTLLFDLRSGTWSGGVAAALGLRSDLLPAIRPPAEVAGLLSPSAAGQLGLRPGLPVATGAADTAASLLAAGLRPGEALLTLGTGGQLITPAAGPPGPDGLSRGLNLFCSADGGTYWLAAAQNVGVTLDWVCRTLGASWGELYAAAGRPWRADTPVFLPYLAGERWDHQASGGAWTGLTLAHQRDDLLRAALEGVAFLLRGKLDDLRSVGGVPAVIRLAGGGSRHPAWRQLLADALSVPLIPAAGPLAGETGWLTARGAAMLAAAAAGLVPAAAITAEDSTAEDGTAEDGTAEDGTAEDGTAEDGTVWPASPLAEAGYRRFRSVASQPGR